MTLPPLAKISLALCIGALGGVSFYLIGLPLPWMLLAVFASMAAAILGAPVLPPNRIRPATVAVIGVMLGARFTPDFIAMAGAWGTSLGLLALICSASRRSSCPITALPPRPIGKPPIWPVCPQV